MSVILIAFNWSAQKPENKINSFLETVKSYNHIVINNSCYVVSTDDQSLEVCEKLKPYVEIGADAILITLLTEPCTAWGYLLPDQRTWFREQGNL